MADYLISKDAVQKMLLDLRDSLHERFAGVGLRMALEKMEGFQPVEAVKVMHGRWEKVRVWKDNPQTTLRCSLCKTCQPIYEHDEWKYCPFCGQPMDAKDMDVPTKDGGAR